MVGGDDRDAGTPQLVHLATQATDRQVAGEQGLGGDASDDQQQPRVDQCDLAREVGAARGELVGMGVAIARRPAL